jgi:hypothetical protein
MIGRFFWLLSYCWHSWLYDRTGYGRTSVQKKRALNPTRNAHEEQSRLGFHGGGGGKTPAPVAHAGRTSAEAPPG